MTPMNVFVWMKLSLFSLPLSLFTLFVRDLQGKTPLITLASNDGSAQYNSGDDGRSVTVGM
jgi:hypothetical protein